MPTITYTLVHRCGGGGHTKLNVNFNNMSNRDATYHTDQITEPLNALTPEQQETLALLILKIHFGGKTRQEIAAEFTNPVVVTI